MKSKYFLTAILIVFAFGSCKKFLDAKPDAKLAVPSTLNDLRLMLDANAIMNQRYPYETEVAADNYYVTSTDWAALTDASIRNYYVWEKDDQKLINWSNYYAVVLQANLVLEYADKLTRQPNEVQLKNIIKGEAYFYRGFSFFEIAQVYCAGYDPNTASTRPGIPLRLSSDFNEHSTRASVQVTYDQILSDMQNAAPLLPVTQMYLTRPSRAAAYAMLSRIYLSMENYGKANQYADSALSYNSSLLDYNSLNAAAANPITRFNTEVYFHATGTAVSLLVPSRCKVDSVLYNSYNTNDLRKTVFFKNNGNGSYAFKGDYDGSNIGGLFVGPLTDEMYLNRAECQARLGNPVAAMNDLNSLLLKRWKTGSFVPLTASTFADALNKVLIERRKELLFRGLRWTDLRRLNRHTGFETVLKRIINSQTISLLPNSDRYVFLIPKTVIDFSGMEQNP